MYVPSFARVDSEVKFPERARQGDGNVVFVRVHALYHHRLVTFEKKKNVALTVRVVLRVELHEVQRVLVLHPVMPLHESTLR